jgi:hypothetical protein
VAQKVMSSASRLPQSEQSSVTRDSGYHSRKESGTSVILDNCETGSSTLAPNHFKGDMVWANFGYLLYNGRWVDPDCQRELPAAHRGRREPYHYKATLSAIDKPRRSGPKVMSHHEQNEFYNWYVKEVSDDTDAEGDPRNFRITEDTFAFWAQGAIKGKRYEHKVMEPQVSSSATC